MSLGHTAARGANAHASRNDDATHLGATEGAHSLRRTRTVLVAALVGLVTLGASAAPTSSPYWDFGSYGKTDPASLLSASIDSGSIPEKVRIRSYLAAKYPQTVQGLAARA